jgi:hypothetical protein
MPFEAGKGGMRQPCILMMLWPAGLHVVASMADPKGWLVYQFDPEFQQLAFWSAPRRVQTVRQAKRPVHP